VVLESQYLNEDFLINHKKINRHPIAHHEGKPPKTRLKIIMKTNVGCFVTPNRHNISNQPNFGKTSNKNISTCNHAKEHY